MTRATVKGRGASFNPKNRFETLALEKAPEGFSEYFEDPEEGRSILTKFYVDQSRSILAKNDSPDIGFTYSVNPYRGCEHGCIYCYARPTHEYLGFSSGLDFETKIMVKPAAAVLLDEQLSRSSWQPQTVMLSGDTDCYQPIEKKLQITRRCLEVFLEHRNPVSIVTKNALVQRDADILRELASMNLVTVTISITSLNHDLIRKMEPRTSIPAKRLETINTLTKQGIPVAINACPIIPGLNDVEIPSILEASSRCGARHAGYAIVRLPNSVKDLFVDWLKRELPDRASTILNRIREVRNGKLTCADFGKRLNGEGQLAETIEQLFQTSCKRLSLNESKLTLSTSLFRRTTTPQINLF
ncbi:MAG: PA0069 family radical SAM protein [Ignavibacteriales bacterium]|nr:PA0069 family radical SAM protein [Ignavibacteriales bacterium]